jgi:hypothetical protein
LEEAAFSFDDHAFAPMVSLEMNVAMFKSQWQICDRITEYLSDILGQGHSDPARYSNFVSVAANELIELAFRSADERGRISFRLYRSEASSRLRIAFPCEQELGGKRTTSARSGETRSVGDVGPGNLATESDAPLLLRNLATMFRAAIQIEQDAEHGIQIVADFPSAEDFH